jgi:hypothetical protein
MEFSISFWRNTLCVSVSESLCVENKSSSSWRTDFSTETQRDTETQRKPIALSLHRSWKLPESKRQQNEASMACFERASTYSALEVK